MSPRLTRLLISFYPKQWRTRYGEEFAELLAEGSAGPLLLLNIVWSALREHVYPTYLTQGESMERSRMGLNSLIRHPSAFLPPAMSVLALTMVLGAVAFSGVSRDTDEGTVAHLFQILMAGQVPIIAFFAIKWLPRAPRSTMNVLALMVVAALAACAPVFLLKL